MDDKDDEFRIRIPSGNVLLTLAREHLPLLVPIIGALIFAFRCVKGIAQRAPTAALGRTR